MRLLAFLCSFLLMGAAALAGQALWHELSRPEDTAHVPPAEVQPPDDSQQTQALTARIWPPIFGEPQPPVPVNAPHPPADSLPPAPVPPKPPLSSLSYTLNGTVLMEAETWAMVGHPSGGRLLRAGDWLEDHIEVIRIDQAGLWVSRYGDAPELLAFPE